MQRADGRSLEPCDECDSSAAFGSTPKCCSIDAARRVIAASYCAFGVSLT
jgi:hypothetical protein